MGLGVEARLRALQEEYGDRLITVVTVLLLVMMFVVAPLQAAGVIAFQAVAVIVALFMIGSVLIISASLVAAMMMLAAFSLNVVVIISRLYHPLSFDLVLVAVSWLFIVITLGSVVARTVFGTGRVNRHRIVGAILLYLLIAIMFVSLFMLVALSVPNAFNGFVVEDSPAFANTLIYFSFVTLTSTGYGEILPVHPVARSLCNLETIVGQLYPATLLARLVTLELEARR